ncbi:hypothetical protein HPP92_027214 [Vanilla planifolia]|uniref:C2H2-type domain-containing protein n=1 Tax=Vanilla planifolia TaxID=51239 RepID=A0A835PCL2_VANPL|nr:hypothetical protein HPP92_027214 [Vanilla planifolia]
MGGKELAVWKVGALNLREIAARETLRRVRQEGHVYVELRPLTAKRSIFFCTLCLTQCFSEAVLYDHLRGNLHSKRYAAAKITLLLPNPWPFNDGVLFFTNFREKDLSMALVAKSQSNGVSIKDRSCGIQTIGDEVISMFTGNIDQDSTELTLSLNSNARVHHKANGHDASNNHFSSKDMVNSYNGLGKISECKGVKECLIINDVLLNEQMIDLEVNIIGFGCIGNKIHEDCEAGSMLNRIWCAWLGDGESDGCDELPAFPKCDFAIVNLSCTYDLGRKGVMDDEVRLPLADTFSNRNVIPTTKKKKSFSDPEDSSDDFIKCASSLKHSHNTDCCSPCHSYASSSPPISCRILTQELRKQKRSNAERNCDICRQPMLPGKDVATLLNLKTGRLACSSRNINGAFHLFHASCLIHWILLCELKCGPNRW